MRGVSSSSTVLFHYVVCTANEITAILRRAGRMNRAETLPTRAELVLPFLFSYKPCKAHMYVSLSRPEDLVLPFPLTLLSSSFTPSLALSLSLSLALLLLPLFSSIRKNNYQQNRRLDLQMRCNLEQKFILIFTD